MNHLIRALSAERLKMKSTLAWWLALIAPAVVVALQFAISWSNKDYYTANPLDDAWVELALQTLILWALLMLPLFVTLETALIAQMEHSNHQWKHQFALPISRGALYAAKQINGMVLMALSNTVLVILTVVAGLILRYLLPGIGFDTEIPWESILLFTLTYYLASWMLISIHTWVAQHWPNFAVASAFGVAMTVIGVIAIQSDYAGYYPWTLPVLVANGFNDKLRPFHILDETVRPVKELLVGSLGGLLFAWVAGWRFTRRDVLG